MTNALVFGDRYEVIEKIGSGGMADVYKAYDQRARREVAVKVIKDAIATDEENMRRFREEAKIIMGLNHPNILPIYDVEFDNNPLYIVMRYLKGGNLLHVINKHTIVPLPEIVDLLQKIAQGIDVVHDNGIIHRDITPNNIMLDIHGNVYITDFGVARIVDSPPQTLEGAILGTVKYMAPEQIVSGDTVDKRADLYSLGIIIFEMATGAAPFEGHIVEIIQAKINQQVPSALEFNPDLPEEFDLFMNRALARSPENRFKTAQEMTAALQALVNIGDYPDNNNETVNLIITDVFNQSQIKELREAVTTSEITKTAPQRQSIPIPTTTSQSPQWILPIILFIVGLILGAGAFSLVQTPDEPTLDILSEVRERGYLNCGVNGQLPSFSMTPNNSTETRIDAEAIGYDADYCRAIAIAVFGTYVDRVNYIDMTAAERLLAVENREVDVLIRNTTWTVGREQAYDIAFGPILYYDSQGFMFHSSLNITEFDDLDGLTICVLRETTSYQNLLNLQLSSNVPFIIKTGTQDDPFINKVDLFGTYALNQCDGVTGDATEIISFTTETGFVADEHDILRDGDFALSKEPLAPVYHSDDAQWASIVNYAIHATIAGAEMGVTSENVTDLANNPDTNSQITILLGRFETDETQQHIGDSLGIDNNFAENIIATLGNYDEIYERNISELVSIERGLNQLYTDGGIMYAIPFTLVDVR